MIGEVRDTLYDLRTDVTESQSLSTTLEAFLERVKDRSGLVGHLRMQETGRLPILQERELWRIAQEAVTNVERHARATQVTISWRCDGTDARLEIADDGIGFPVGSAGRLDSYGLLGHAGAGGEHRRHAARWTPSLVAARGYAARSTPGEPLGITGLGGGRVTIRVLLADDHRMLREGLRRSLTEEGFDIVGEAENGEQAVRLAAELQPDVVLMDVSMPELDGVEPRR